MKGKLLVHKKNEEIHELTNIERGVIEVREGRYGRDEFLLEKAKQD